MEILARLLPEKVGNLFSINSIREDLKVSFETIKSWIGVFENFFLVFLIPPLEQEADPGHSERTQTVPL